RLNEIGDASKEQADGHDGTADIGDAEHRQFVAAREEIDGKRRTGERAMERHAALPHRRYLFEMRNVIGKIIEQHVTNAAAEHDTKRAINQEVVEALQRRMRRAVPQRLGSDEPTGIKP